MGTLGHFYHLPLHLGLGFDASPRFGLARADQRHYLVNIPGRVSDLAWLTFESRGLPTAKVN